MTFATDWDGRRYEVLPLDEALAASHALLDRLCGVNGPHPDAGEGLCDDCGKQTRVRSTVGAFTLCRGCTKRRRSAARQVDIGRRSP